jgi:hypothetical protein
MRLTTSAAALAAVAASSALAQPITLFEHENFNGRRFVSGDSVPSLQSSDFNDRASSAVVRTGRWQLCSDAYFRGQCAMLGPGEYPSLRAMGMNDRVSSIREVGWRGEGNAPPPPRPSGPAITLYAGPNLTGRPFNMDEGNDNLANSSFNDRAASAEVRYGTWLLCADARFQGRCQEFRPGRYADLGPLTGNVSSARVIAAAPPPPAPMPPSGGWGSRTRVVLYDGPAFTGRTYEVDNNYLADMKGSGFNDRTASIRVERGYWIFCTDANFQGECRTLGPGDYSALPYGLVNRISSLRRISEDYPYAAPPSYR